METDTTGSHYLPDRHGYNKEHIANNQMMPKTYLNTLWHYHPMSDVYAG